DDAISVDGNAIWIHISDISSLVSENSAIGNEAYLRSESLYTPEQTVPMLPVDISENTGSLLSHVERQCLSLKVSVNEKRDDIDCYFAHTLISNDHDLSYEQCDEILLSNE
ncbi:MAG: RNB domain-containing ribonuclease, partial [SAR202 cluster bacterium]|nr:RNB domain-containing ribonuclease [SAR202 cluster bacterium]